jgi:hypothetical protein
VGYANNDGQFAAEVTGSITAGSYHSETRTEETGELKGSGEQHAKLAYSNSERLKEFNSSTLPTQSRQHSRCAFESWRTAGWPPEPNVGRVAHGVPFRVDRLKALGNAQVPRVATAAWEVLIDIDK